MATFTNGNTSPDDNRTPRKSALAEFAASPVQLLAPEPQPDINALMAEYMSRNANDPETMVRSPALPRSVRHASPAHAPAFLLGRPAYAARAPSRRALGLC